MASVQDLKRRIRSVRNTRKITRAMELVAAAKLRRAEQRITALRPYAETMNELIAGVGRAASSVRLPLLEQRESVEAVAIVPLTGDRGLAGSFNAQIVRRAFALERSLVAEGKTVRWVAVGKKGRSTLSCPARSSASPTDRHTRTHRRSRIASRSSSRAVRSIASSSSITPTSPR
jgi:F-type H+-transporting ATPase subunit gamma